MKSVSVLSSKDRVGKTTVSVNLAVILAKMGNRVCLLENDFYNPSFMTFFKPDVAWVNSLLLGEEEVGNCVQDFSETLGLEGKLYVGFADPSVESRNKFMRLDRQMSIKHLRNMQNLRAILEGKPFDVDYLIIDNPAWAGSIYVINSIVITDSNLFLMKLTSDDVSGTTQMLAYLYKHLESRPFILVNFVPDYIIKSEKKGQSMQSAIEEWLAKDVGEGVVQFLGMIPVISELEYRDVNQGIKTLQGEMYSPTILSLEQPNHILPTILTEIIPTLFKQDSRNELNSEAITRMMNL